MSGTILTPNTDNQLFISYQVYNFIQQMNKWIIKDLLFSFSSVHVNAGYTLTVYQMACLNVYANKSLVD